MIYSTVQKLMVKNHLYNKISTDTKLNKKIQIPMFPKFKLKIEIEIFKIQGRNEEQITRGHHFIRYYISSKRSEKDNNVVIVSHHWKALKNTREFIQVLDDLMEYKIIDVIKHPEEQFPIRFVFHDNQDKEYEELYSEIKDYLTASIVILEQNEFDKFVKQKCMHNDEYQEYRFKKIHICLAKVTMLMLFLTLIFSSFFSYYQTKKLESVTIKSICSDTLNVSIRDNPTFKPDSTQAAGSLDK